MVKRVCIFRRIEYLYNIDIIVTNTTLHGNKVAIGGGGGLRIQHTSGDEPHQCDAREPHLTLHITDVNFVNNTAVHGGNFLIMMTVVFTMILTSPTAP